MPPLTPTLTYYLPYSPSHPARPCPTPKKKILLIASCGWLPCKLSSERYGAELAAKGVRGLRDVRVGLGRDDIITMTFLSGGNLSERLSSLTLLAPYTSSSTPPSVPTSNTDPTDETLLTLRTHLRYVTEIYFISHSQGVPFAFGLAARGIEEGWIEPEHRLGFINLAGATHGSIEPLTWTLPLLRSHSLFSGGRELILLGEEGSEEAREVARWVGVVMRRDGVGVVNYHAFGDAQVGLYSSHSSLTHSPHTLLGLIYPTDLDSPHPNSDPLLHLLKFYSHATNSGYTSWPKGLTYVLREVHGWAGVDWAERWGKGESLRQGLGGRDWVGRGHGEIYAGWEHLSAAFRFLTSDPNPIRPVPPPPTSPSPNPSPKPKTLAYTPTPLQKFLHDAFTDAALALGKQHSKEAARIQVDVCLGEEAFGEERWRRMEGLLDGGGMF